MPLYNVHLYREMRLKFAGIEADTLEQAAQIARALPDDQATEIEGCDGLDLAALVDLVGDDDFTHSQTIDFDLDWSQLLASRQQVAIIWCVDDVRQIRPDLNTTQAMQVLEHVRDQHDAMLGVSWTTLECAAEELFGAATQPERNPHD